MFVAGLTKKKDRQELVGEIIGVECVEILVTGTGQTGGVHWERKLGMRVQVEERCAGGDVKVGRWMQMFLQFIVRKLFCVSILTQHVVVLRDGMVLDNLAFVLCAVEHLVNSGANWETGGIIVVNLLSEHCGCSALNC